MREDRPIDERQPPAIERLKAFLRRMPYVSGFVDDQYLDLAAEAIYVDIASEYATGTSMDADELQMQVRLLVDESRRQTAATRAVVDGVSGLVDVTKARIETPRIDPNAAPWTRHPGIRKALARIMDDYAERLTTEDLSNVACLGKSQFMAAFKSETGMTPHEFLRRVRIDSAVRLLQEGNDVTDTCYAVGFSSLSGFETAFVDIVGMTPLEFRKRNRP